MDVDHDVSFEKIFVSSTFENVSLSLSAHEKTCLRTSLAKF